MAMVILLFGILFTMNKEKAFPFLGMTFLFFMSCPFFLIYIYAINYKYEQTFILTTFWSCICRTQTRFFLLKLEYRPVSSRSYCVLTFPGRLLTQRRSPKDALQSNASRYAAKLRHQSRLPLRNVLLV